MAPNGTLYDCQKNRRLSDNDLPNSLTPDDIISFCNHHDVHFHACGTPAGIGGTGWDDSNVFRVGTNEVPSRGITVLWNKVSEWKEAQATMAACYI
jgi:hypothetical protein